MLLPTGVTSGNGSGTLAATTTRAYDIFGNVTSVDGPLTGTVRSLRATAEQFRLVVDVDGVGAVDAVAPLDVRLAPGEDVRLRVDPTRVAAIPAVVAVPPPG